MGFLALTDAAPLIAAHELGIFSRHGLKVELQREIGWATIRDKIVYGELDLAQAPAPILWSTQLGLGCPATDVLTAFVLSLHGNAITLSQSLWERGVRDAATLRAVATDRRNREPLTFGVVFPFSSHHLQLLEWLRAAGLEPERDVRIAVVPPAQMYRNLAAGTVDGYCVGEPWNSYAVQQGTGWCPTWSAAQQPQHIEKVLMARRRFVEERTAEHGTFLVALAEAAAWCDEPQNRERLADVLADARHLNLSPRVLLPALQGRFDCGHGRIEAVPDFHIFHRGDANVPTVDKAVRLQRALGAAGLIPAAAATDPQLPRRLFREDLHRHALTHYLHEQTS